MSDDYVPGAVDEDYDYSKDDKETANPIAASGKAVDIEEGEGFDPNFRGDVTAEQIEKGSFRFVKPGVYSQSNPLYVKSVQWHNEGKPISNKWYVKTPGGEVRVAVCDVKRVNVTFAVPGDENCTVRDWFYIPINPNQLEAFEFGFSAKTDAEIANIQKNKKREEGGFFAKKLKYFIARLGYQSDSQGRVPLEAGQPAKWLRYPGTSYHRYIGMEVEIQQPGKNTQPLPEGSKRWPQPKMFSYTYIEPPPDVKVAQMQAKLAHERVSKPVEPEPNSVAAEAIKMHEQAVAQDEPSGVKPAKGSKKKQAVS
jgi:hypothetical protein